MESIHIGNHRLNNLGNLAETGPTLTKNSAKTTRAEQNSRIQIAAQRSVKQISSSPLSPPLQKWHAAVLKREGLSLAAVKQEAALLKKGMIQIKNQKEHCAALAAKSKPGSTVQSLAKQLYSHLYKKEMTLWTLSQKLASSPLNEAHSEAKEGSQTLAVAEKTFSSAKNSLPSTKGNEDDNKKWASITAQRNQVNQHFSELNEMSAQHLKIAADIDAKLLPAAKKVRELKTKLQATIQPEKREKLEQEISALLNTQSEMQLFQKHLQKSYKAFMENGNLTPLKTISQDYARLQMTLRK